MEYTIDLRNVKEPESMHDIIEYSLPVPEYYGRNLDALYDVLTSMPAGTIINIYMDSESDIPYLKRLTDVFRYAECDSDNLDINFFGPEQLS